MTSEPARSWRLALLVTSALSVSGTTWGQAPGAVFQGIEIPLPNSSADVVRGDLDNDGDEDLFVGTDGVTSYVLISDGHGGFVTHSVTAALLDALTARLGDLDNDGNLDVIASGLQYPVMVALGDGHGDFGTANSVPNSVSWLQGELADLNGDGNLDLAGGSRLTGKVGLWLGNGSGTLVLGSAPTTIHFAPFESRLQDIDGDVDLDLVLAGSFGVRWFANDNQGSLLAGSDLVSNPVTLITEFIDLNGDTRDDLITSGAAGFLNIFLAQPAGAFAPPTSPPTGLGFGAPVDSVRGDLNGDGKLDLALLSSNGTSISVLLSNGIGGFGSTANHAVGTTSFDQDVEMFDADGDGDLDLAAADGRISVLFNDGSGSFGQTLPASETPVGLVAVDFDHDDHLDLVATSSFSQDLTIYRGDGHGSFQLLGSQSLAGVGGAIAAGDVSGDGHVDLVVALPNANSFQVLLGNGAGGFVSAATYATGIEPRSIALGDVTGDALADIAIACSGSDQIRIYRWVGGGALAGGIAMSTGDEPYDVVLVDLTGDGVKDIACPNLSSDTLTSFLSSSTGTFIATEHLNGGNAPSSIAAGDLNGDGRVDLVTSEPYDGRVAVFLGMANGAFSSPTKYVANNGVAHVEVADVDRDGRLDVIAACSLYFFQGFGNSLLVLRGNGDGTLSAPSIHPGGIDPTELVVADFDEDGRPDAAMASENGIAIFENLLPDCGPITNFGSKCSGTLATAPSLALEGCASVGAQVSLRVSDGPANSTAVLFFGTSQASLPVPYGCSLLVAPLLPFSIALPLSAAGASTFATILPPATSGIGLVMQAFVINPLGSGFGATNGVGFTVTGP